MEGTGRCPGLGHHTETPRLDTLVEQGLDGDERTIGEVAETVGVGTRNPGAPASDVVDHFHLEALAVRTAFADALSGQHDRTKPTVGALPSGIDGGFGIERNHRDVDALRDVIQRWVAPDAFHLASTRVDRVDLTLETPRNEVMHRPPAQRTRRAGGSDHGDRSGVEDAIQHVFRADDIAKRVVRFPVRRCHLTPGRRQSRCLGTEPGTTHMMTILDRVL